MINDCIFGNHYNCLGRNCSLGLVAGQVVADLEDRSSSDIQGRTNTRVVLRRTAHCNSSLAVDQVGTAMAPRQCIRRLLQCSLGRTGHCTCKI